MKFISYLTDPALRELYWPGVIAGVGVALMGALLSPLAVLKRMSFVGQGISHAAFGGIGIVAILVAFAGTGGLPAGLGEILSSSGAQFAVVLLFCLGSALVIARLTERGRSSADTAIGIVLVGTMALGAVLVHTAFRVGRPQIRSWDAILFGDILAVSNVDAVIAWLVALGVGITLFLVRRPLVFWAFDERAAEAFGVPVRRMKYLLVILLSVAIVTAMKLAGVVLATALLVLPGAIALRLSERARPVMVISLLGALVGVLAGLVLSFELDLPPGASIVGTLVLFYAAARAMPRGKTRES